MTGAMVKDMSQDLTKLLLVFYICFHFIDYLLKTTTEKPLQIKNTLCLYSAWDTDCWCKQYKYSMSFIFCLNFSIRLAEGTNLRDTNPAFY